MQPKLSQFAFATVISAGLLALGGGAVAADTSSQRSLTAAPGVAVPLAVESSGRDDCSVGPLPETRVVTPPSHGALTHAEGRLQKRDTTCPAAAGYVVLYVPDADFNGDDMVTLEISEMGMKTTYAFDIMVKGKITPPDDGV